MAPVELFRKIAAKPFEPFRIVLSDGSGHEVKHPDGVMVGTRTSVLSSEGDQEIRIDNLHVTKIEPIATVPTK